MRSPLAQTVRSARVPAPVGGWNRRDALQAMPKGDAVVLDNFIPGAGGVTMRGGYQTYATGLGAPVRALLRYNPPSTSPRLFAAAGSKLFDASAGGAVGAPVLSGLASDRWQGVTFGTPGGSFLVIANGADAPRKFDGGTWSNVAIVEPQPATYNGVAYAYPYNLSPQKLAAPNVYTGAVGYKPALKIAVDYDDSADPLPQSVVPGSGAPWGSPWGTPWGPRQGSSSRWQTVRGLAQTTASVLVSVASLNPFRLEHVDVLYEVGGLP